MGNTLGFGKAPTMNNGQGLKGQGLKRIRAEGNMSDISTKSLLLKTAISKGKLNMLTPADNFEGILFDLRRCEYVHDALCEGRKIIRQPYKN